jgi:hypothetical protein
MENPQKSKCASYIHLGLVIVLFGFQRVRTSDASSSAKRESIAAGSGLLPFLVLIEYKRGLPGGYNKPELSEGLSWIGIK